MTNNELLNLLKDIKSKPISIKFDITDKYDYIVDIYYDEEDECICLSTRGTGGFSAGNWYEDIPEDFDHVIRFIPDLPKPAGEDGEHTEEQHEELTLWNVRLQALMEKERARSN